MDPFAAILVAITAVTICGICVFIFVCALQPRFLRRLHGRGSRTSHDIDSNTASNDEEFSVKSLDLVIQSREAAKENSSTVLDSTNRDKKAYLKSLEQSLRTGRRMNTKNDNDDDDDDDDGYLHSTPSKFIRHFINKYIRRTRQNSLESTEL